MGKQKYITESEIAKLICERGILKNDHVYYVPVRKDVKIEFDGRICVDSYEDLPSYAPCIVTVLYADSITEHVWFNQKTNFNTMFGDPYNDDYNLHILSQKNYKEIVEYLNTIPVKHTKKKSSYKNEWSKLAYKFLQQDNWYSECGSLNKEIIYSDFIHSVDCWFCCDHNPLSNDIDKIIEEKYLNNLDNSTMIAIKMLYPTINEFNDDMYLSNQTIERAILQHKFINTVMKKVWDTVSDETINNLYTQDPNELCKHPTYKFKFKQPIEFINPVIKEISKPSKHTVKSEYKKSDFISYISINDLWINASYGICITDQNHKEKIIPAILKDIAFLPDIKITPYSFEFDPYSYTSNFLDYFNSISNYFGECSLILTFENQLTNELFDIKCSPTMSTYYMQNNCTYRILLHKKPYKYPNIKNEFIENECNKIVEQLKISYQQYLDNCHINFKKDECDDIITHTINGLTWTNSIRCKSRDHYFNTYYTSTFSYKEIFSLIPEGYRLPTSDEVIELLSKNKYKYDSEKDIIYIGKMKIYDDDSWWDEAPGIWTSDSYTGNILDHIKVVVNPMYGGIKKLVMQNSSYNFLILIKK